MSILEALRERNPQLPVYGVDEEAFAPYGRVVPFNAQGLIDACRATIKMPAQGSAYVLSEPVLQNHPDYAGVRDYLRGGMEAQMGVCWGYNTQMQALEYHRSSEHNIAVTDMVLLLCDQRKMRGNDLDAGHVAAFYVPAGTTIEVYATTMHFCPCQVSDQGFICLVVLPEGTNAPLAEGTEPGGGEGRLLYRCDKWLVCHEESRGLIEKGVYPGIHGKDHTVRY